MRRKISFFLAILMTVCLIVSSGAYADSINLNGDYEDCVSVIDTFIDAKYNILATLQTDDILEDSAVSCTEDFARIEQQLITAQMELMNDYKESLRFKSYHLTKNYGNQSINMSGNIRIDVSVKCEFNYEISPEEII